MTINIELSLEEERVLLERARLSGRNLGSYIHQILHEHLRTQEGDKGLVEADDRAKLTLEDLLDDEAVASCEKDADDRITLEEVRAGTSTIRDSMARVVIEEERAE